MRRQGGTIAELWRYPVKRTRRILRAPGRIRVGDPV
jgi:hypothetical protein